MLAAQAEVVARKGQDLAARAADVAQDRLEVAAEVAHGSCTDLPPSKK